MLCKAVRWATLLAASAVSVPMAQAEVLCSDPFDEALACEWGNEVGDWSVSSGAYDATQLSFSPVAQSSLPFVLTDFVVEVDVSNIEDGGLWLRSSPFPSTRTGRVGVLLVTGGFGGTGTGLYWHVVEPTSTSLPAFGSASGLFTPGVSSARFRVEVIGDSYSVFVDGATTAASTFVTSAFSSGQVALYDNSGQTFDNFVLTAVPEPSALWLCAGGLLALGFVARRR